MKRPWWEEVEQRGLLIAPTGEPNPATRWVAASGFGGTYGPTWIDDQWADYALGATPAEAVAKLINSLEEFEEEVRP